MKLAEKLIEAFSWGDAPPKSNYPEMIKKELKDAIKYDVGFAYSADDKAFFIIKPMKTKYKTDKKDDNIMDVLKTFEKKYQSRGYMFSLVGDIHGSKLERF
jgi:hypothetical protein